MARITQKKKKAGLKPFLIALPMAPTQPSVLVGWSGMGFFKFNVTTQYMDFECGF